MRGYQHRISHQLVKDHQIICIEDTGTANMTRSAKGTIEKPGRNVKQKAGLKRSILAQGWYGLRTKIEYKADWYERQFIAVPAHHTSQRCSDCGYVEAGNPDQSRTVQVPELRTRNKCRHQRVRKYPAPRSRNLGQGRKPQPGCTAGDPRGQQTHQTPPQGGLALYTRTRSAQAVAKFPNNRNSPAKAAFEHSL